MDNSDDINRSLSEGEKPWLARFISRFFVTGLIFVASIFGFSSTIANAQTISRTKVEKSYEFHLIKHDLDAFNKVMEGHDPFDFENWKNIDLSRHSLEILIFTVAPILGGCECNIILKPFEVDTPHYRSIEMVRYGGEVSHPVAVFGDDPRLGNDFFMSDPILHADEFFVGLFTHIDRKDVLRLKDNEDIENLTFIAGYDWEIDNAILDDLGLRHELADNWITLLQSLMAGRADVVMQPFTGEEDFGFYDDETKARFVPIPEKRMRFPQDRRYFVSKQYEGGEAFFGQLNKGINILDGDDRFLRQAHIWAGVINPKTENFDILFE